MARDRFDDPTTLDAIALADLVRRKQVHPIELVEAAIKRIEHLNPAINAVITPMYEAARTAANGPLPDGPFKGVPFLLKDLGAMYAGVRMSSGSKLLFDFKPPQDSELTARYKRAGLIIIGKTNTPEFGLLPTTEPRLFGPTRNPWDTTRTAGGSSGGSAAAVAARFVPMAHGSDGGGSIRIPASCCGVFGLKPTRARIPMGPRVGDVMSGLVSDHALTRSVRDCAALLDATAGGSEGDPYCAPPQGRPFLEEVGANPGKLRIALTTNSTIGTPVHPDCVKAARDAARLCADLGHDVTEAEPALNGEMYLQAFMTAWAAGCAWTVDGIAQLTGHAAGEKEMEPGTWTLYQMGKETKAADYLMAVQWFQQMDCCVGCRCRDVDSIFIICTPQQRRV